MLSLLTVTVLLAMVVAVVVMVVMVVGGEASCDCGLLWSPRVCRDPAQRWTLATGLLPPLRRAITATNHGDIISPTLLSYRYSYLFYCHTVIA